MKYRGRGLRSFVLVALLVALAFQQGAAQPHERDFQFSYQAVFEGLKPGASARIWAPLPQDTPVQKVGRLKMSPPLRARFVIDDHKNRLLYMEGSVPKSGRLVVKVEAAVHREEWLGPKPGPDPTDYLGASRLVPVDGEPVRLLDGIKLPEEPSKLAHLLYNVVLSTMTYDKSKPGYGRGDSVWACNSRTGNCTDFHSLFLSLARSRGLAARFEIGYPVPDEPAQGTIAGYHCWASFWTAEGWVPVDISEADKHPDKAEYFFGAVDSGRVTLSQGRDLVFDPPAASGPLNYFVRPLLEVNGKPVEATSMNILYGPSR